MVMSLRFAVCFLLLGPAAVAAQTEPRLHIDEQRARVVMRLWHAQEADAVKPTSLTLHPKSPPARALRYHLLPEQAELTPGDAAPLYKRLEEVLKNLTPPLEERRARDEELYTWEEMPLAELPRDKVRKFLDRYCEVFQIVDQAARREYCDWKLIERLREKGIGTLLPEVQFVREATRYLALRIRLALGENRLEDALRDLQTGFAVARHLGESPVLINYLVGIAITDIMTRQMEQLIQQPQAPNLYWALTDLPRPLLDMRKALQGERITIYGTFPGLGDAASDLRAGPFSPERVEQCVKTFNAMARNDFSGLVEKKDFVRKIQGKHEAAKRELIAQGRPRELVEKMPHVQVALLHSLAQYDRFLDDFLKCDNLPYWEAQPLVGQAEAKHKEELKNEADAPALPFSGLLMPAVNKVLLARVRMERKVAALRCLEAMRLYADAHNGKLPATLGDVKEVPLPVDPLTGKAFEYRLAGEVATLLAPPRAGEKANPSNHLSYEVRLKR
jgi:hypothetical protein